MAFKVRKCDGKWQLVDENGVYFCSGPKSKLSALRHSLNRLELLFCFFHSRTEVEGGDFVELFDGNFPYDEVDPVFRATKQCLNSSVAYDCRAECRGGTRRPTSRGDGVK